MRRRLQEQQVRSALQLIGPMGDMIETMHKVIVAHHPAGFTADDCPVCLAYQDQMEVILRRWEDVRSVAAEHWPV